jgi:tetratricopeptide (TPR) repeat protein
LQVWLALPNCSAQTYIRAGVLLVAGNFSADTDLKQANLYIQESIEIARKLGDSRTLAKGLSFMGYAYNLTGQFQEAIEFMDEAYAILQEAKLDWETTELLRLKGFVLLKKQDLAGVKATAEQNLKLCRQLGNTHEEAATLRTFGILAMLDRQVFEAKRYFQESLAITCELGDKQCTHHGLGGISLVAEVCNEKELAAWLGGAFESFSETNGYGVGMYISPTANEIWTALKADLPEIWAYGRKASYDETVSQAISFVAEMK